MHLGVQHSRTVVHWYERRGGDECSNIGCCVLYCCCCAYYSRYFDPLYAEASREQEKASGGVVDAEWGCGRVECLLREWSMHEEMEVLDC